MHCHVQEFESESGWNEVAGRSSRSWSKPDNFQPYLESGKQSALQATGSESKRVPLQLGRVIAAAELLDNELSWKNRGRWLSDPNTEELHCSLGRATAVV